MRTALLQAPEQQASLAQLQTRGRWLRECAIWLLLGWLFLMPLVTFLDTGNHIARPGFGDMLQVPASLTPYLNSVGLPPSDAAGWKLVPDADSAGYYTWLNIKIRCIIAFIVALCFRRWPIVIMAAVGFLLFPSQILFHPLRVGEAAMISSTRLVDHPSDGRPVEDPAFWTPGIILPQDGNNLGTKPRDHWSQTGLPRVVPVQLNVSDAPAAERADMAYVLAQAAFKDDNAEHVAQYMSDMGSSYPQSNRVTRDRIRILDDYLVSRNKPLNGPRAALPWLLDAKNTLRNLIFCTCYLLLIASGLAEYLSYLTRNRVKRLRPHIESFRPVMDR